ncbi:unnamed protein product, partial [Ectocarpus fasciculatus]
SLSLTAHPLITLLKCCVHVLRNSAFSPICVQYGVQASSTDVLWLEHKGEFCGEKECHLSANRRPPHQEQGVLGRRQHTRRKRCGYPGCTKAPSYGEDGGKTVEFCAQHTQQGMVDVVSKGCGYPGCATRPKFGEDGSKKAAFCAQHAQHDMVNVRRASRQFSH